VNVRKRGRKDAAANGEHFAADADGFGEIAVTWVSAARKRLPKLWADEAVAGMKTVLKETAEKGFVFRKGHMQLRMSPGRRCDFAAKAAELPPSSVT